MNQDNEPPLCACGCGERTSGRFDPATGKRVRWIQSHGGDDPRRIDQARRTSWERHGRCVAQNAKGSRCRGIASREYADGQYCPWHGYEEEARSLKPTAP